MSPPVTSSAPVEKIKAVNHHLRLALDQVSDAVLILQPGEAMEDGPVVVWANEAAAALLEVPVSSLAGAALSSILAEGTTVALSGALELAARGQISVVEVFPATPGTAAIQGKLRATRGAGGQVLGYILTLPANQVPAPVAVTEAESVPQVSSEGAPSPEFWQEDVIETIRETARQVAHEFNNALTSIVLPVQLAIRAIPPDGELFESLEIAHVSAQRASDLAKDFLDCFRPRSAVRSRTEAGPLLGRSIRLAVCARNISWRIELEDHLPDIEVEESQIERVMFNLIRNSCQAMPNGGRLRVSAGRRDLTGHENVALPPGEYLQISVRDWGPGIPEEHLHHLFHGRFTTKPDGNGCGLPICYQIIRDHGGEMLVRSRVHVGTEFILYLPALPALPPENAELLTGNEAGEENVFFELNDPVQPQPERGSGGSGRTGAFGSTPDHSLEEKPEGVPSDGRVTEAALPSLLVVDDEQGVRTALSQIARAMGFEVLAVATSEEALQIYKDRLHAGRPYSTVLLDLNLRSGLNGREVFHAIRRMDPEAQVVATSGQHAEGDVERFRAMGFAGFLAKPYSLEQFDQVMRAALAS